MSDNSNFRNRGPRKPGGGGKGGGAGRGGGGESRGAGGPRAGKSFSGKSSAGKPRDGERPPRRDGERSFAPRSDRPARARDGERKFEPRGDRPFEQRGERPPRREGERSFAPRSERPARARDGERKFEPRGDKPFRARDGERPFTPRGERPPRREGERPFSPRGERPKRDGDAAGARPFQKREAKPRFDKGAARPRRVLRAPEPVSAPSAFEGDRIAKVLARVGLCSRRDAEAWIKDGRIAVNGEVLTSPAVNVTGEDRITVDGKPIAERERTRLFLFHKPRGLVTTDRDPEGRPTIFDALPEGLPRVVTVGRLDINTEGLLLLTNDGGLARVLELPATGWLRRYRVRANGETDQAQLDALRGGVTIDGVDYAGIEAHLDRVQGANVWLTMGLREGKNREIKRVLEHLGLAVNRLIRLSFGPFQLGELEEGAVEEVKTRILADQIGPNLAEQAGADFESPIAVRERTRPEPEEDARPARAPRGKRPERDRAEEPARPRQDRPKPGPRKHVSVLRAARAEDAKGERRRIERGATADRSGREVAVERIVGPGSKRGGDTRNGRRFAEARAPERKAERRGATAGDRPRTGRNKDAKRGDGGKPRGAPSSRGPKGPRKPRG